MVEARSMVHPGDCGQIGHQRNCVTRLAIISPTLQRLELIEILMTIDCAEWLIGTPAFPELQTLIIDEQQLRPHRFLDPEDRIDTFIRCPRLLETEGIRGSFSNAATGLAQLSTLHLRTVESIDEYGLLQFLRSRNEGKEVLMVRPLKLILEDCGWALSHEDIAEASRETGVVLVWFDDRVDGHFKRSWASGTCSESDSIFLIERTI